VHSLKTAIKDCENTGVMFSLHVKATMMKISHPIVFGHAVKIYYKELFDQFGDLFDDIRRKSEQRPVIGA